MLPGGTAAISCSAGPAVLAVTPSYAAAVGGTVLKIGAGYFAAEAPSCGGAWCRLAPLILACVFNFTAYYNAGDGAGPKWHSQLWLANATRQVNSCCI